MNIEQNILAIPSKGRFMEESVQLLNDAGIPVEFPGRKLTAETSLPEFGKFTVALMRPKDILDMVLTDQITLGVIGQDTTEEYGDNLRLKTLLKLGIGKCRLVLAAPVDGRLETAQDFDRITIATSYPRLTTRYLIDTYLNARYVPQPDFKIRDLGGAVEATPALGLADAIADLVESGESLKANNDLREIDTILNSEAILITSIGSMRDNRPFVNVIRDRLDAGLRGINLSWRITEEGNFAGSH